MTQSTPFESPDTRKQRERERATAWIQKKWTQPQVCPICETNDWTVTEVVEVRGYEGGSLVIGGSGLYPMFQVICGNCGFTHFFNAVLTGVVDGGAQT